MQCLECAYETVKPCDWRRHILTQKHLAITGQVCTCGRRYKTMSSFHRHQKSCAILHREQLNAAQAQALAVELERLRADIATRPTVNNTFNLNFFLTDTCKHASTLGQFINSTTPVLDPDKSIDQFFYDSLSRCAIEDRPIHCVDLKRQKLVIKTSDNAWEQDQSKIDPLLALHMNILRQRFVRVLDEWILENPTYMTDDKLSEQWVRLIAMIMSDVDNKFVANIAKRTQIEK